LTPSANNTANITMIFFIITFLIFNKGTIMNAKLHAV
jgi:hypothetical protein